MAKGLQFGNNSIRIESVVPPVLPPIADLAHAPRPPVEGAHPVYPFENLCFEGGGSKGIAYCGAISVLEEAGIYPNHIRRIAGTSSGSFLAAMLAVGYSAADLRALLFSTDLVGLMQDARFGRFSALINMWQVYGFNPGARLIAFLGERLEERTGSPDVTFAQVWERCGRELCIPITNITRMVTEYCHPKTTPDMPVKLAVGMSMSLPVLMQPYKIVRAIGSGLWDETDYYTDGGLLCNYPLHAFDGWWLDMKPENAFVRRLRPLRDAARFLHHSERFAPRNPATLGLTVFDAHEPDVTASWVPEGGGPPERPDTRLSRAFRLKEAKEDEKATLSEALGDACERLVDALHTVETSGDGRVSREEAARLFETGKMTEEDATILFGTSDIHEIFRMLDRSGDGFVCFDELLHFMDAKNIDLTARALGGARMESASVTGFMSNLFNTMLHHIRRTSLHHEDRYRTVPIHTDYVGTADFRLEADDRQFLLDTGEREARAFLANWRERRDRG